jgi:PAS domain S-box-containing protein
LRYKLAAAIAAFVVATFALLAGHAQRFVTANLSSTLHQRAESVLTAVAAHCSPSAGSDEAGLADCLARAVGEQGIAYACVTDAHGRAIISSDPAAVGTVYTGAGDTDLRTAGDTFDVSEPISLRGHPGARLRVGISTHDARARLARGRRQATTAAAVMAVLAMVGTWFVVSRITRPLVVLRDGALAIGRGELGQRIRVKSGDEIEELAQAFNRMAAELESVQADLEQRIAERTRELAAAYEELLEANKALERSEQRYRSVVERANDAIYVVDVAGNIISANRQLHQMVGCDWRAAELVGKNHTQFVHPDDAKVARAAIDTVVREGAVSLVDLRFLNERGQPREMRLNAVALREGEKVVGAQIIARDVTEQVRIEHQLAASAKLRSLGELAAGIAHEINSPMCAVVTFLQMVEEEARAMSASRQMLADLKTIREQSERVVRIAEKVLAFAKQEANVLEPLDVNEALVSGLDIARYGEDAAGVDIRFDLADNLPRVTASRDQLQEVFLNLAVNAQQAMAGGGILTVRTRTEDGFARIDFTDTGPGISSADIDRVFEPGFSTKAEDGVAKGLGLGLFLSQRLIASLNGTISVQSEPTRGATFTVRLPALIEDRRPRPSLADAPSSPPRGRWRHPSRAQEPHPHS